MRLLSLTDVNRPDLNSFFSTHRIDLIFLLHTKVLSNSDFSSLGIMSEMSFVLTGMIPPGKGEGRGGVKSGKIREREKKNDRDSGTAT